MALISVWGSVIPAVKAAGASEEKGAKIYCFMRSSGNDHEVSWNAAYALIKRQRSGDSIKSYRHILGSIHIYCLNLFECPFANFHH